MPVAYPLVPLASAVSAPAVVDPVLTFSADAGYLVRRARTSRPRRRYTMEYLGLTTADLRLLRDFVVVIRGGATTFSWTHPTATEQVTIGNTTPVTATFAITHALMTGDWLWVDSASGVTVPIGAYQVTRVTSTQVTLNGTTAAGAGTMMSRMHLANAMLLLAEDTFPEPVKLIGPEAAGTGRFNVTTVIQEVF